MTDEETNFLKNYDANQYERLSVAVDVMLLRLNQNLSSLQVLMVKRNNYPFKDYWALPGSFVKKDESAYTAACRALKEKTGIDNIYLEQLYTMSQPNRDPRTRIVSIAYIGLIPYDSELKENNNSNWFDVSLKNNVLTASKDDVEIQYALGTKNFKNGVINVYNMYIAGIISEEQIAFDHSEIILEGLLHLKKNVFNEDYVFNLVAKEFTLVDLTQVFEIILGKKMYKNVIKRDRVGDKIEPTGNTLKPITSQRSSTAYRYKG